MRKRKQRKGRLVKVKRRYTTIYMGAGAMVKLHEEKNTWERKKNRGGEKFRIRKMRLPYSPEAIKSFFPEQGSATGFPSTA
jgi:hypothetical protein